MVLEDTVMNAGSAPLMTAPSNRLVLEDTVMNTGSAPSLAAPMTDTAPVAFANAMVTMSALLKAVLV